MVTSPPGRRDPVATSVVDRSRRNCAPGWQRSRTIRARLPLLAAAPATLALAACGSDAPPAGPRVEIDTIGDTTMVRTLSGSVWAAEARLVPEV